MNAKRQTANVCDGSRGHVVGGIAKAGQLVPHVLNGCLCLDGCVNVALQLLGCSQQLSGLRLCFCTHGLRVIGRQQFFGCCNLFGSFGLQGLNTL